MTRPGERVRLSLLAVLAGWLTAACATTPLEIVELVRNAVPGRVIHDLVEGCAIWYGFTLLVSLGVWLVLVLGIALLVPPRVIVRYRLALAVGAAALGAVIVGTELDLWRGLARRGPESPLESFVLRIYMGFSVVFAGVVTWAYSRLLVRRGALPQPVREANLSGKVAARSVHGA